MKKYLLFVILFFSHALYAQEEVPTALEKISVNIHDKEAIKRGAKFFAQNCMVCHTMVYMRYDSIAKDAGVVYEKMPINMKTWPLNVTPPDLSLEASRRGVDWIYTYLHSFYSDPSRPFGVNNLLVPNTAMSGILVAYQGQQIRVPEKQLTNKIFHGTYQWYDQLVLQTKGSMTPEQFDATIKDVVSFLQYASTPYQVDQERIGIWVMVFLAILFVLVYLLKREYWKDLKRDHKK